jgi:hypothetical protein
MRTASCSCGAFALTVEGEPVRVSVCHCLACQKRTGSAFGAQARFTREQIVKREGNAKQWERVGDSGMKITFSFCPTCGSTVCYEIDAFPGVVAIAVGAFADPKFGGPTYSVYETRQHAWVRLVGEMEHHE